MKNFVRVVRLALPYRLTIVGTVLSALAVAVLWGGNIGAVYPFIKVVFEGKSLQQWVDAELVKTRNTAAELSRPLGNAGQGMGGRRSRSAGRSWSPTSPRPSRGWRPNTGPSEPMSG